MERLQLLFHHRPPFPKQYFWREGSSPKKYSCASPRVLVLSLRIIYRLPYLPLLPKFFETFLGEQFPEAACREFLLRITDMVLGNREIRSWPSLLSQVVNLLRGLQGRLYLWPRYRHTALPFHSAGYAPALSFSATECFDAVVLDGSKSALCLGAWILLNIFLCSRMTLSSFRPQYSIVVLEPWQLCISNMPSL